MKVRLVLDVIYPDDIDTDAATNTLSANLVAFTKEKLAVNGVEPLQVGVGVLTLPDGVVLGESGPQEPSH